MTTNATIPHRGKMLQIVRRGLGMTQEELAARAGLSQAMLCRLERGARKGRLQSWLRLADALGVSLDKLDGLR